jgi:hypothetical protein
MIRLHGKTTYPTSREVDLGVAFLDEHVPDWRDKVDPDTLRMTSSTDCVCGQVFGDWRFFCETYRMTPERAIRLGFIARTGELRELTEAWKAELA